MDLKKAIKVIKYAKIIKTKWRRQTGQKHMGSSCQVLMLQKGVKSQRRWMYKYECLWQLEVSCLMSKSPGNFQCNFDLNFCQDQGVSKGNNYSECLNVAKFSYIKILTQWLRPLDTIGVDTIGVGDLTPITQCNRRAKGLIF